MTNVFSYQGGSKSHAYVWEMDPPEHIHGHLLGGSISHGGSFPMQQDLKITKRKAIGDLNTKALRNRLSSLKSHLDTVA